MTYFNGGEITLTQGSKAVTITGAIFGNQVLSGDQLFQGGVVALVEAKQDNNTLELASEWAGATVTTADYQISRTGEGRHTTVEVNAKLTKLIDALGDLDASDLRAGTVPKERLFGRYDIDVEGDAKTLGGQAPAFYQNASNLTGGTVPAPRMSGSYNISITGSAASATNAGNAATLGGQAPNYYTDITARLGYTAFNQAGGDLSGAIRFPHANETDANDGIIGAGTFAPGLNIVGVQTEPGGGRKINLFGALYANGTTIEYITKGQCYQDGGIVEFGPIYFQNTNMTAQAPDNYVMIGMRAGGGAPEHVYIRCIKMRNAA